MSRATRKANREAQRTSRGWFDKLCKTQKQIWKDHIARALQESTKEGTPTLTEAQAATQLKKNAKDTVAQRDSEITSLVTRGAALLTAAAVIFTVKFAVAAINQSADTGLAERIILALAFALTIVPFTPPIRKAWREPYMDMAHWTGLDQDDFTGWVLYCYLGDRRRSIATRYKRFHSVAVCLYVAAWALSVLDL